jgi:hypothetical protein
MLVRGGNIETVARQSGDSIVVEAARRVVRAARWIVNTQNKRPCFLEIWRLCDRASKDKNGETKRRQNQSSMLIPAAGPVAWPELSWHERGLTTVSSCEHES